MQKGGSLNKLLPFLLQYYIDKAQVLNLVSATIV